MTHRPIAFAAIAALAVVACSGKTPETPGTSAQAASSGAPDGPGGPGGPGHHGGRHGGHHGGRHGWQAAIDACNGKAAKDTCSVTFGERTVNGSCNTPGSGADAKLMCIPAPPQAIFDACTGKAAGDTCSATVGERTFSGKCGTGPMSEGKLGCHPEGGPGGHRGPPPEAFTACEGKSADAACSISTPRGNLDGTCSAGHGGDGKLACRPKGPPPGGPGGPPPGGPGGPPGGPGGPPGGPGGTVPKK